MAVETSVLKTLTALELRSLLAQLETAVWEQMDGLSYGTPGNCRECIGEHNYA